MKPEVDLREMSGRMRQSITGWILMACLGAGVMVLPAQASDLLRVKTDHGKIAGKMSTDGQVREFLGIPYAAAPVGKLRWQPPLDAKKWHGVRQATSFGSRCMQAPIYPDMVFSDSGQSEDCLTLNVWTPAKKKNAKLPVMVWIYGGGYVTGSSSEPRQDGEHLAHKGVLIVSMNYRLGIFGFLATNALAHESENHAAGNYGLMDQAAALQWVQNNIAAFGGDPKNVTIFGESAGIHFCERTDGLATGERIVCAGHWRKRWVRGYPRIFTTEHSREAGCELCARCFWNG